ncbi:helicase-exonuclease AddAB subunit AddB [Chryseomicrobium sp. FSL W7-1435]|uniref:helicase-exonuclease AddAB subunit AddB n=1 Tax=Chryseomicrobium sp. FSL W7-1435 TaxID=2921704 RepID=UPI00315A6FFE
MALRWITGRTGSGKTTAIMDEMITRTKQQPLGDPLFYLVPDQMSFTAEWHLARHQQQSGLIRSQVTTFKRLAWRVLQETGGITREEVNGVGYRMLIRSLLREQKDQFLLFNRAATKKGFTDQMESLLKEISRYNLTAASFEKSLQMLQEENAPIPLQQKAQDLLTISTELESRLGTQYIDGEGHLRLLVEQIPHSSLIAESEIYIDSFTAFTPIERAILEQLMIHAKHVHIALPLMDRNEAFDEDSLFHAPATTLLKLEEVAIQNAVEIVPSLHLTQQLRLQAPALRHIEQQFDQLRPSISEEAQGIRIVGATNPRVEVNFVANQIRELVFKKGYRFKEIAVVHRDPTQYEKLLTTIFAQLNIPHFSNEKRPMLDHPLIELSKALFEIHRTNYSYESMFRAIKTGLFFPVNEASSLWQNRMHRLENFVLERGIRGDRWRTDSWWRVKRIRGMEFFKGTQTDEEKALEAEQKATRDQILHLLDPFVEQLQQAITAEQVAQSIFSFMSAARVPQKLAYWQQQAEMASLQEEAVEHRQVWKEWVHVLEQFELMFRNQSLTIDDAAAILEEGLDQLSFSKIPPSLDQIVVGQADTARYLGIKALFVLGVNDGTFPKRVDHEGLLTDEDRAFLQQAGLELAPSTKERLREENYVLYKVLTTASEAVYVSYSLAGLDGKPLLPSTYIKRLQSLFTSHLTEQVSERDFYGDAPKYINHPRIALTGYALKRYAEQELDQPLSSYWQDVESYLKQDPYWQSVVDHVEKPLTKQPGTEKISRLAAEGIYSSVIKGSVSRVETYYSCPFKQFATYGLELRGRDVFKLEAPAMGDLFHAALKWISDYTTEHKIQWNELSRKQCNELSATAIAHIVPLFFNQLLLSTNRYHYITKKLTRIVASTMNALRQHSARSKFHPIAIEVGFGLGEQLPPLELPLSNNGRMELRGRIDRVDVAKIQDRNYIRVIDYKSSKKALDLNEVYHGLSLQLLTYLDVATHYSQQWLEEPAEPGGVLYVHLHEPTQQTAEELSQQKIEELQFKSYKMEGLVTSEWDVLEAMDNELTGHSDIVPVHVKKDGSFGVTSKILSSEELKKTGAFVRKRHRQAGGGMLAGDARVLPYKLRDKMPCDFCAYRSVCQFDPQDTRQPIRKLAVEKPAAIVEKINKEVDQE